MKKWMLRVSVAVLGLLITGGAFARDADGGTGSQTEDDTMIVLEEGELPEAVDRRIELPESVSETGVESSVFGLETANEARERNREARRENMPEEARERMPEDVGRGMPDGAGRGMPGDAGRGRPDDAEDRMPEGIGGGMPESPGEDIGPPADRDAGPPETDRPHPPVDRGGGAQRPDKTPGRGN